MKLILPTRIDAANYDFTYELDGVDYRFDFKWNERDQAWNFSIYDAGDLLILAGVRVVVNYPLISRFRVPGLPPGSLCAVDTTGAHVDPGFGDLGDRVKLVYTPIADLDPRFVQTV